MTPAEILIEIIGWTGAGLILLAYILLSFGKLAARSLPYQAMNVAGATGFILNSGYHGALPNAALNVIWVAVGLFTLWSINRAPPRAGPGG
ncbi:MAG: hypothetical protein DI569_03780 [Sphingopyxis macrogoltabida]|uniref:CBU-0592-like domain-containing protein n=1 Tax=Sphingopyxis macrogoltabida TaxID=33050 RepID=A0A2W5LAD7_SPHMC|nr:MAG: hypothetical protein DI569_03780 [Sphingopyxis macrogoltabida]